MSITEMGFTIIDHHDPKHRLSAPEDIPTTIEGFNRIAQVAVNRVDRYEAYFKVAMNYTIQEEQLRHPIETTPLKDLGIFAILPSNHPKWSVEIGNIMYAHPKLTCVPTLTAKIEHYFEENYFTEDAVKLDISPAQKWFGNEERFDTHCLKVCCHRNYIKQVCQALYAMEREGHFPPKVRFLANQLGRKDERTYHKVLKSHTQYVNKIKSIALRDVVLDDLYTILNSTHDDQTLLHHFYDHGLAAVEPSFTKVKVHFLALDDNLAELDKLMHEMIIPQLQNASSVRPTITSFQPTPQEFSLPDHILDDFMKEFEGTITPDVKPNTLKKRTGSYVKAARRATQSPSKPITPPVSTSPSSSSTEIDKLKKEIFNLKDTIKRQTTTHSITPPSTPATPSLSSTDVEAMIDAKLPALETKSLTQTDIEAMIDAKLEDMKATITRDITSAVVDKVSVKLSASVIKSVIDSILPQLSNLIDTKLIPKTTVDLTEHVAMEEETIDLTSTPLKRDISPSREEATETQAPKKKPANKKPTPPSNPRRS